MRVAVGREVLRAAAEALRATGIALVPLKGVYLHACVYEHPEQRPITDVDVLVPEHRFDEARVRLETAGWRWSPVHASEAVATHASFALPLDVHRRLFLPGVFDLSTEAVFARARVDASAFGVQVCLPDPQDVLAHLVGHFVKSRGGPDDHAHLEDFERLARSAALDPGESARHLERVGMARAARHALGYAATRTPTGFASRVLAQLRRDRVGDALAWAARFSASRLPAGAALGAWSGFALERSLARGGIVLARHVLAGGYRSPS